MENPIGDILLILLFNFLVWEEVIRPVNGCRAKAINLVLTAQCDVGSVHCRYPKFLQYSNNTAILNQVGRPSHLPSKCESKGMTRIQSGLASETIYDTYEFIMLETQTRFTFSQSA